MKLKLTLVFVFAAFGCAFSQVVIPAAYGSDTLRQWTLETCLQYAKDHNIVLNTLRLSKEIAAQDVVQAKAALLPDLNGSLSSGISHVSGQTNPGASVTSSAGLNSSMTLYNGGALKAGIQRSKFAEEVSELDVLEAENDLYVSVIQAYNAILLDKETIKYATDLVATTTEQLKQMEALYRIGSAARKELVQIEAQLANDQYTLTTAQNAERQDKIVLKQLLQLPMDDGFDIVEPDTSFALNTIKPLNQTVAFAMANRPEVRIGQAQLGLAAVDLKIAKAGYYPTISLNGGIGTDYSNGNAGGFGSQLQNHFYQQVGITASIPIFSRKQNETNTAKASVAVKQAELNLLNTQTILSQEVEQAYIAAINATRQYDAALQQLRSAQESYRIAGEELRVGTYNTVEFVQQKNQYVQALQAYTQSKYNALLAIGIYEFYHNNQYP